MSEFTLNDLSPTYSPDLNSFEAKYQGQFVPCCAAIMSVFDKLDAKATQITAGPLALANRVTTEVSIISELIDKYIKKLDDALKKLIQYTTVDSIVFDSTFFDWYSSTAFIRRVLGEADYWILWENYSLLRDKVEGVEPNVLTKMLIQQAVTAIELLIDTIKSIDFSALIQKTRELIVDHMYDKLVSISGLPTYFYPQVTTRSIFRQTGDVDADNNNRIVGEEVGSEYYTPPVKPAADPTDPGYAQYLAIGNLALLQKPLLNKAVYDDSVNYWKSNWRLVPNENVNQAKYKYGMPRKGVYGPYGGPIRTMNHRLSIESAYPVFNADGSIKTMSPYKVNGKMNTTATPPPPSRLAPNKDYWSLMDIMYEIHCIVLSVKGVCTDAPTLVAKWENILNVLGVGAYVTRVGVTPSYLFNHSANHKINGDPVVFGSDIINKLFSGVYAMQAELVAKIAEVEKTIASLPQVAQSKNDTNAAVESNKTTESTT